MRQTRIQAVFLVILRLVCGSHFFYQGMIKLADSSWSSYSYLMNSEWILADVFRWMAILIPKILRYSFIQAQCRQALGKLLARDLRSRPGMRI